MTDDDMVDLTELLTDADLFHSAGLEVIAYCIFAGRDDVATAVSQLKLRPGKGKVSAPDGKLWNTIRGRMSDVERLAWKRFMFATLKDSDQACANCIQSLLMRRVVN